MNQWRRLLDELMAREIRYVLVGGLAVNLHGVPRLTADLDIVLALDPDNTKSFVALMEDLGYRPRVAADPRGLAHQETRTKWIEERGMQVFTFWHPQSPFADVDVLISLSVSFDELWAGRCEKRLGETRVQIAGIPHLKTLKQVAGRKQDLADIEALERVESLRQRDEQTEP